MLLVNARRLVKSLTESPDQAIDGCRVRARSGLVALVPGHVRGGAAVADEQVLVEVRHAPADDRREDVLCVKVLRERAGEPGAEEAEGTRFLVSQVLEMRGVALGLDEQVAKGCQVVVGRRRVVHPEAAPAPDERTLQRPLPEVLRADRAVVHGRRYGGDGEGPDVGVGGGGVGVAGGGVEAGAGVGEGDGPGGGTPSTLAMSMRIFLISAAVSHDG